MRHSLALILLLALTACGSSPEKDADSASSVEAMYADAKDQLNDGAYEKAVKAFEALQSRYPYGRYAQQAQLEIAYAYFKQREPESALAATVGTRSFWEGVDVVAQALSALVIVKLPFAVPSDPVVAARSETFEDPFYNYSVPDAILRFRQGFGRLIRSKSDRGVVVVMDQRVISKTYGQLFLDSLPRMHRPQGTVDERPSAAKEWVNSP